MPQLKKRDRALRRGKGRRGPAVQAGPHGSLSSPALTADMPEQELQSCRGGQVGIVTLTWVYCKSV